MMRAYLRKQAPTALGLKESLDKIAADLPDNRSVIRCARTGTGGSKAGMGDQKDKPPSGLEYTLHGAKGGIEIRNIHEGQTTHHTIKALVSDGNEGLSILNNVVDVERLVCLLMLCRADQRRRLINPQHSGTTLREQAGHTSFAAAQVTHLLTLDLANQIQEYWKGPSPGTTLLHFCRIPVSN
jgi:hypothetical protein